MPYDSDNTLDLVPDAQPSSPPPVRISRRPRTKRGTRLEGVDPKLVDFAARENLLVTSGRDSAGVHVRNSAHGGGGAIDFRTTDRTPAENEQVFARARSEGLGVLDERAPNARSTGPHGHLYTQRPRTTTPAPKPADAENTLDQIPDAEPENTLDLIPDAPPVSRETKPQVSSTQPQVPPPGAQSSAPTSPPATSPTQPTQTPQPSGVQTVGEAEQAGAPTDAPATFPRLNEPGYSDALKELIAARGGIHTTEDLRDILGWLNRTDERGDLTDPEFRKQVVSGKVTAPAPAATTKGAHTQSTATARGTAPAAQTIRAGVGLDIDIGEATAGAQGGSVAEAVLRHALNEAGYSDVADAYLNTLRNTGKVPLVHSQSGEQFTDDQILETARTTGGKFPATLSPEVIGQLREMRRQRAQTENIPASLFAGKDSPEAQRLRSNLAALDSRTLAEATTPWSDPINGTSEERRRSQNEWLARQESAGTVDEAQLRDQVRQRVVFENGGEENLQRIEQDWRAVGRDPLEVRQKIEEQTDKEIVRLKGERAYTQELLSSTRPLNVSDWWRDVKDRPSQLLPFVGSITEIADLLRLRSAAQRMAEGRPLEEDKILLRQYHALAGRDQTTANKILTIITGLPSFFGEMALTEGPYALVKGGVESGIKKALTREGRYLLEREAGERFAVRTAKKAGEFGVKAVGSTAGGLVQTVPAGGLRIVSGTLQRMNTGESFKAALAHASIDQMIEVVSEHAGGAVEFIPGVNRLAGKMQRFTRPIKRAGVHDVFGEMFEERVGEWAKWLTGLQPDLTVMGVPLKEYATLHGWAKAGEQFLVEAVSFSAPGVSHAALHGFAAREEAPPLPFERPQSDAPAGQVLQPMRARFAESVTNLAAQISELQQTQEGAAPEEADSIQTQLAGLHEERQHYAGLVRDIDAHHEQIRQIEAEIAAHAAEAETPQPAAAEEPKPAATQPEPSTQPAAERRERERTPGTDLEYFQNAFAERGGTIRETGDNPFGDNYELKLGGETARVDDAGDMKSLSSKAREMLIRDQLVDQTAGTRKAPPAEEDLADEITRQLEEETQTPAPAPSGARSHVLEAGSSEGAPTGRGDTEGIREGGVPSGVGENSEWSEFPTESGTLGVPRAQMPQIHAEHRGALVQFLKGKGISHEQEDVLPDTLKPTQAEYNWDKVLKARNFEGPNRSILVSSDDYVLDGHHQWLQAREDAPEVPYPVIRFNAPIRELLPLAHEFPSSTVNKASEGGAAEQPMSAEDFADEIMRELSGGQETKVPEYPAVVLDVIRSPEHAANIRAASDIEEEAAPPASPENVGRGLSAETPPVGGKVQQPSLAGQSDTVQTGAREAIRTQREEIKRKLEEARTRRRAADAGTKLGALGGGVPVPSREEVVLTAQLLLTYAQEGTLLFKEAARRFVEDVGGDYAQELAKAFEAGWRLLQNKGFGVDAAGSLAETIKGESPDGNEQRADESTERRGGAAATSGEEGGQVESDEEIEEAPQEEYVAPNPLEAQPGDPRRVSLGRKYAEAFLAGKRFANIIEARRLAATELKMPVTSGTPFSKEVDEAIEIGIGLAARETVRQMRADGAADGDIYARLVKFYTEQQPNLSVRTSTSAAEQAYSTPAPLAFVASRLAGINRRTTFLDNSAGNGMLGIEAAPEAAAFNEKNADRFHVLEALFPLADVRQGDALKLDLEHEVDRYIANPPFGVVKEGGEAKTFEPLPGWKTSQIDHAIAFAGLGALADKGRAVIIVGSVQNETEAKKRADQYDAKAKRLFYYHLYRNYNVTDHFTVSGDLYERQGAGWPVDVIVIDGRGKSERRLPAADPPRVYTSWADLSEVLDGAHREAEVSGVDAGDRPDAVGDAVGRGGDDATRTGVTGRGDISGVPGGTSAEDVGEGRPPETATGEPDSTTGVGRPDGEIAGDVRGGGARPSIGEPRVEDEAGGVGRAGEDAAQDLRGQPAGEATRRGDQSGDVAGTRTESSERRPKIDVTKAQVPYAAASTSRSMGTLTPVNMATAAQDALDRLVARLAGRKGVRGPGEAAVKSLPLRTRAALTGARLRTTYRGTRFAQGARGTRQMREGYRRTQAGTLDRFVADRLGYDVKDVGKYFGAEQIDSIALAIDNIERGAGMIIGDQCVAAGTRIYDPVAGTHTPIEELAARGQPITVLALTAEGLRPTAASAPFRKGEADLFRVVLDGGREITVTSAHRFLTPLGWSSIGAGLRAGHFLASAEGHPACSLGFGPSVRAEDARHWMGTPEDSLSRCSAYSRQCGEQLPWEADSDQDAVLRQGGAPARNRPSCGADGRDASEAHSRPRQYSVPRSRSNSSPSASRVLSLTSSQSAAFAVLSSELTRRSGPQSDQWITPPRQESAPTLRGLSESCAPDSPLPASPHSVETLLNSSSGDYTGWRRIVSIDFVGYAGFFDMWVPEHENYVAEGIIHHNTGIGKGRVVAAVLRYARLQNRVPLFITEKPNLYKDMARDLEDIGEGTLEELRDRILMTNANLTVPLNDDAENPANLRTPDAKEHNAALLALVENDIPGVNGYRLPKGKQYLFTTYSQMQKIGGATIRQKFLHAISEGAVIVFDESHNAGGTEASGWGKKKDEEGKAQTHDPLSRAGFARGIIERAHGVFYSSATYAKRASVMSLYSKTDMGRLKLNMPLEEIFARGGIPMQQIAASMLAESGQYSRRERSFEGIEYATAVAPVDQESAETVSSVMKAVFDFDEVKKEVVSVVKEVIRENAEAIGVDPATGAQSANSTSFSSLIHNLVDQMLLSLKMESAIEHALDSLRANEKPVITVAFTMGSFLQQYAEEFGLQSGEAVGLNFGDMLKRYLDRTRDVTYKRPDNTKYRLRLTDEQLGPRGVALYDEAVRQVQEADWSRMPVSPIDYIKYRIESEVDPTTGRNYKVGEITGRTYALDYSEHFKTKGEAAPAFRRRSQKDKSIKGRISQIVGFNEGSLDVMVLNQAGSTGLSLHASERVSDQRVRHMIVAQPERNIDTHMQLLGRVHRTGQVVLPRYTQLVADIPSEKRPAAVLAKKMASLNANTTAARGSKFKADTVVDFMNQYGDEVAKQLMENNHDLHEQLGAPLLSAEGEMAKEDAARKVTGRLPILTLAEQERVYDELESEYNDLIERLNALGENALEAQTLALDAKTISTTEVFKGTGDRPFERGAVAEEADVKRLRKPYSSAQVLDLVRKALAKRFGEMSTAPPSEADEGDLPALGEAGRQLREFQRDTLEKEFDVFLAKELESVVATPHKNETQEEADSRAEQRRRVTETRHRDVLRRWQELHARFNIGQTVQVVSPLGVLYGVVTDIHRSGRTQNPAALGAWKLQVALADAARAVPIPFSKIVAEGGGNAGATSVDDYIGENYAIADSDDAEVFDFSTLKRVTLPVLEAFERGQSVTRERRTIITGNLLAGFGRFEKSRGQIINFTDSQGNLRQGILMPKDFNVQEALDAEPIVFREAAHILEFLDGGDGLVNTPDGHFKIVKLGRDYRFTASRARGTGQQYWGNQAILDAAERDFVTRGDYMQLVVNRETAGRVIDAAMHSGVIFQTDSYKERARNVTGQGRREGGADSFASPRRTKQASKPSFTVLNKGVPAHIARELVAAETPQAISDVIAKSESDLAKVVGRSSDECIDCDVAADLMSQALKVKNIPHQTVVGYNDVEDSHAWVRVNGKNYDPTDQGFGDGTFEVATDFHGQRSSESGTASAVDARAAKQINAREWWHVPPAKEGTYAERGKFYSPSFKAAELYGIRGDAQAERVSVRNPLVGSEDSVELELLGRLTNLPASPEWIEARLALDKEVALAARRKGYDAILKLAPESFEKYKETGKIQGVIELSTLHDLQDEEELGERGDLASGSPTSRASSRGGQRSLNQLADQTGDVEDFTLSERAREVLARLGVPVHEKTLSSRLLGLFKLRTKGVRVQALPDVFTVAHEAMHSVSTEEEIGERLIADTKRGHYLREDLTRLYTEFYPKAKPSHALRKRVEEGLAMLMQEYLYDPAYIQSNYPRLVNAFIKPTGKYNTPKVSQLLAEMASLIGDYVRMTPEQQFGARVARGPEIVESATGFAPSQRYVYEVHNDVEPLRRMGLLGAVSETRFDPDVAWVQWKQKAAIFHNWMSRKSIGLTIPKLDGTYQVISKVSVERYLDMIGKKDKEFDWFLVARRVVADHNQIAELRAEAADPTTDPERAAEAAEQADKLKAILEADKLPGLPKAVAVVTKYADEFKEAAKMFDQISRAVVEMDYQTGLITRERRDELHQSKGYAPYFKAVFDELRAGKPQIYGTGSNPAVKGRSYLERRGSENMIISPVFNQMSVVAEQLSKGMENIIWRRVLDLAEDNTEIARRFEPVTAQDADADERGRTNRKDIITVMVAGKREYRKAAPELLAVAQNLHPDQLGWFSKLLIAPARLFQTTTTGINPFFGLYKNIFYDQPSAAMNTRTGYVPYVDAAKTLGPYLSYLTGANEAGVNLADPAAVARLEKFLALGGKQMNRFAQYHFDEAPEKVIMRMLGRGSVKEGAEHALEVIMTTGELPNNISEIMTRFAEYSRALDQGRTEAEALYLAAEVTTNFQRIGHLGKHGQNWVRSVPYMQSSFNVLYKFARQWKEDPKRVAFVMAAVGMVTLASTLALLKSWDDDKYRKQRKEFMDASADDLQRYVFVMNPFGESLIRIPVPNELGQVTGLVQLYAIQHYGGNKVSRDELFDTIAAPLPEQMQWQKPGRALWSFAPIAVKPTLQVIANQQSYPNIRPIVGETLEKKEPYLQFDDYTTAVSVWVAYQLRDTPFAPSPKKLDFWIRAQLGPMGALLTTGKVPDVPLFDQERPYQAAERAFDRFKGRQQSLEWQYKRLEDPQVTYSPEEKTEVITAYTLYDKMSDVLAQLGKASRETVPVDFKLKERAWKAMLRLDELDVKERGLRATLWRGTKDATDLSTEIEELKAEITAINEGVLKHLRAQKAPRNANSGLPEGYKRVTADQTTDLIIERRQKVRPQVKLPPPVQK